MRTWRNSNHPAAAGPWADEPDKAQWVDEATGLDCLIVRNHYGALCGYVGLPPEHPWHGLDYSDLWIEIGWDAPHGGLTFAGACAENTPEGEGICHIPEPGRPDNVWWLGFDCAHVGDLIPSGIMLVHPGDRYRDFEYVKGECTTLAALAVRRAS